MPQTRLRFQKEMIGLEPSREGEAMESEADEVVEEGMAKGKDKAGGSASGKGKVKRKGMGGSRR
jgi:hypothetical protein